jgi:Myotubularin-like phosphatase domain
VGHLKIIDTVAVCFLGSESFIALFTRIAFFFSASSSLLPFQKNWKRRDEGWNVYSVDKEFLRQQVKPDQWRITLLNAEYEHCP